MIQLRGMHPALRPYAEYAHQWANYAGFRPVVTSVYRTWEEQTRLRQRWESGLSNFPANRPGDSAHNYGLAWDSWVEERHRPAWRAIREYVGFRVPENDWIHGELPNWRNYVSG